MITGMLIVERTLSPNNIFYLFRFFFFIIIHKIYTKNKIQ